MRNASRQLASWEYESPLYDSGRELVAGVDEVGRGPLAGPVVAAAVILPPSLRQSDADWLDHLNDSKQVTAARREFVCVQLREISVAIGTGAASSEEIDRVGIASATRHAMERAIESLQPQPEHLLIDAVSLPGVAISQTLIIKGDSLSKSIAAASIIAKVIRDQLMTNVIDARYPGYGFASHKGYGSQMHLEAIERLGPCSIHRMSFAPLRNRTNGWSGDG